MSISSRRVPWRFLGPIQLVDATPSTMGAVDVEREVAVCGRARRDVTRNQMEMNCRPPRPGECGSSQFCRGCFCGRPIQIKIKKL